MNKIFSRVWCKARGIVVVASELAKRSHDRSARSRRGRLVMRMLASALACAAAPAWAGVIEPPPPLNNTLPGHVQFLNNWLLGNDYQACGLFGAGCLTVDRANFNNSYLSLVLNQIRVPNVLDLDGNQPANHLTLIGSVQSDSYIQLSNSNYFGNNNNASCIIIGLACTWRTNAAQNNQVLIGDGSYANGSNTVVMGTNARHQLPTVTADSLGWTGGPDANYAARLGNSVVIGDNSFGNADRQTIVGFGATSTHANSVALGAGSTTAAGAQSGYAAFGLNAPQNSSGEVSIGSATAARKLTHVAAGSSASDAVNLAQLQGAMAIAANDPFAVRYGNAGGSPDFGQVTLLGAGGTTISNLQAGAIGAGSTEAVNGSQLFAIGQSNAQHLGGGAAVAADGTISAPNYVVGGAGYQNVGAALDALDDGLAEADAFSVRYDSDSAGNPDYASINLLGPAGIGTAIGNLAAGQIAADSLDAVNGGQLFALGSVTASLFGAGAAYNDGGTFTAPSYIVGGDTYNDVGSALSALDGDIGQSSDFAVQYDDDGSGAPDYANVMFRGAAGTLLDNVAAGRIAADSLQAINGGQLFGLGTATASLLGGGAAYNDGGAFTASNYIVGGDTFNDVGSALSALDGSVGESHAFAVQYDDDGDGGPDYSSVTFRGPEGTGTLLDNVAAGQIAAGSSQAVNGGQLYGLGTATAALFGGGAAYNAGGTFTAPSYLIGGDVYNDVGSALTALDAGVVDGNASAVRYDEDGEGQPDYGHVTLRGPQGTGTVLDNVAPGQVGASSLQAINGSQFYSAQAAIAAIFGGGAGLGATGLWTMPSYSIQGGHYGNVGDALAALDSGLSNVNTRIDNLPPPTNASDPLVSVDGVRDGSDDASAAAGSKGVAVGSNAQAGGDHGVAIGGDSRAAGDHDTAIGGNAHVGADRGTAVGANSVIATTATRAVAVGEGAAVTAASGTALGQGSSVTATGSVAIGQGSVANVANTVSVGHAGGERQITNVAAGTRNTDAVNVGQLNAGIESAVGRSNTYVDNRINEVRNDVWEIDRGYRAATASALAVAGLPQAYLPGKSMVAMAAGSYRQEAAMAIGVTTISEDGRWIYKFSGTTNTTREVGVTIGAGLQW